MNILLIDDSPDFRALVRLYLSKELDNPGIKEYEVEKLGRPPENFNWSEYDVLLLDYKLGETEDGLQLLKEFGKKPGFPPTIILTAEGDEYVAVRAVRLGAADYINKKDISPKRLAGMVTEAAEFSPQKEIEQQAVMNEATQIIRRIHKDNEQIPDDGLDIGYKFVRLIGQGAMSKVYLAERVSDKLSLVLKVLDLTRVRGSTLVIRFIQEAELIAEINSPFVVKIYDHGLKEEYGYIAMEFFSRGDLKQRMELKIRPDVAFNYMTHITYGLDAIHRIGVIHRDLKPANIMFRGDDSLALADFGISKKLEGDSDLTTVGQVLGTPHYMSPEQGEGKPIDTRSDLYSAGVLLYELLAGDKPFAAKTPAALIYQHVHGEIPKLPAGMSRYQHIIDRALAKNPDERYRTAMEFIQVLEKAEQECY
ncbi:MAG: protein kinase [Gammaproteobacteria bacterium]